MMGSTRERKGLNDITNVIERKTTAQMVKVNRSRNQQLIDSHTQQLHANDIVSNLRRSETKHMSSADCFRHQVQHPSMFFMTFFSSSHSNISHRK